MQQPVRWGVLGASDFARRHMARAIHMAEGADLTALATSDPAKASGFLAFAPNMRLHDSYDALLADSGIDAIYIPLPNHLHVEWTRKCLEAGKHVLCEKPIAMRADQIDGLIASRDASGLLAAEAYMIVHHPQWQHARALFEAGEIGNLVRVDGAFSYDNRSDRDNIRNRAETGGGGIPDIGVYTFGSARFVTGEEPTEILSTAITWENNVDVWAHVTAQFPSFHYAAVNSMRMSPWQEMVFQGDRGIMRLSAPFNAGNFGEAQVHLHSADNNVQTWRWPGVNQYVLQVEAFGRALRGHEEYLCPLEFSKGTQRMIDMVFDHAAAK